jgi:hypothetical protein
MYILMAEELSHLTTSHSRHIGTVTKSQYEEITLFRFAELSSTEIKNE